MRSGNGTHIWVFNEYVLPVASVWFTSNDDGVRSVNLRPFVTRWPKPNGLLTPLWWVLGIDGQGREGLTPFPRKLSGFISRCFCGDEVWLNHKCCKSLQQRRGGCRDRLWEEGQMASCPSLSLAVVQPGRPPDLEELCDLPPLSKGVHSGYGCPKSTRCCPTGHFKMEQQKNRTSEKHTLLLDKGT